MINRKKFFSSFKILGLLLGLLLVICGIPMAFSRYQSLASGSANADVAFYILKADYTSSSINLTDLVPSTEPFIYTFTVSNTDGTNRLETRLSYDLTIKTSTNLPLSFDLYLNENYDDENAVSAILTNNIAANADGMYFRTITTATNYFSYQYDETNTYQLVINFPIVYNNYEYENILENIEIIINSHQLIDE